MGYLNPVMQYGSARFMADAVAAGVDGLLLVDLPVEHAAPYKAAARDAGLHLLSMSAPTSDDARLAELLRDASGFVYHVALKGTTGAEQCVPEEVGRALARVHRHTPLPVAAGFGIRDLAQARALAAHAELVVIGSQLVDTLARRGVAATLDETRRFAQALR